MHLFSLFALSAANPWEVDSFNSLWELGKYHQVSWGELRKHLLPGQHVLGHAWVMEKRDQLSSSVQAARELFKHRVIPAVLTDRGLIAVSSHHYLAALEASNHPQVYVNMTVVCDFRGMDEPLVASHMYAYKFLYPFYRKKRDYQGLPVEHTRMTLDDLPTRWELSLFEDDPWRSLVAFMQTVTDPSCPHENPHCLRCFENECQESNPIGHTIHTDFGYAYYLNDIAMREWYDLPLYATSKRRHRAGEKPTIKQDPPKSELLKFYMNGPPEKDHYAEWMIVAKKILPYCHSEKAEKYFQVPLSIYGSQLLVGFTNTTKSDTIPPTCEVQECPVVHTLDEWNEYKKKVAERVAEQEAEMNAQVKEETEKTEKTEEEGEEEGEGEEEEPEVIQE